MTPWDDSEARFCSKCNQPLEYIEQYGRWYCYNCKSYDDGTEGGGSGSTVTPQRTEFKCPACGDSLFFIEDYDAHFCYNCNAYSQPAEGDIGQEEEEEAAEMEVGPEVETEVGSEVDPEVGPEVGADTEADTAGPSPLEDTTIADLQTCPECGVEVEEDWVRCPNCAAHMETGELPDRPVTTHDETPQDMHATAPTLDHEEVPGPANPEGVDREPLGDRRDTEYKWDQGAAEAREAWESSSEEEADDRGSSTTEERKEWEQTADEERSDREEQARSEKSSWQRDAYEEQQESTDSAEEEEKERKAQALAERLEREEFNRPAKAVKKEVDLPEEHGCDIDQEIEFIIEIFEDLFTAFLKEPMEPLSFYRSKFRVMSQKSDSIRHLKVEDDGKVKIFVEVDDPRRILLGLTIVLDSLVETEAKVSNKTKAMVRAKEVLRPVVEEYEEELDDLGILPKILKGAFAVKLPSGIPGFDEMLHGGIPNGGSIIVQGATGGEKEMFANQFLSAGLESEGAIMVAISMISPKEWRTQMKTVGTKLRKYQKEGQVVIVDWYTHKNERVRSVEVNGPIIKSSKSITNLEIAIDKAIKAIRSAPTKRAVIAILSPAIQALGFDKVYGFAQSIRGKFKKYGITGMFLLEKKMHDEKVVTSLYSVFDGVFDIERARVRDSIVRKIGIMSLKGSTYASEYRELLLTKEGLRVNTK